MTDLDSLQRQIIEYRDARDWKQFHNPKDLALSLVLESAELLEHFQWKTPGEMQEHISKSKEEVADELMDVLYWVLLIAHDFEIDIDKAFNLKMQKNNSKYPIDKAKGSHKKYTELTT